MFHPKNILNRRMRLNLLASAGFAVILLLAQTGPALAATTPPLGLAGSFGVLGGSAVTNIGASVINGDLGVSPGNTVTGFPPGTVSGAMHAGDAVAAQAQIELTTAYNNLVGQVCNSDLTGLDLGGMTLTPGAYCFSAASQLTGTLTLDGGGDPNAVWVFQIGTTLTTASNASVLVINGGSNCNVFWQVGSSATLGTNTAFAGNLVAFTSITLNTGANVSGRILARNGAVTLDDNDVNFAVCLPSTPRRAIQCGSSCSSCNTMCSSVPQYVTVLDSASLDLIATTGTIEAWIRAVSCTESDKDAGIVTKGVTPATCYGFGLAGGTLFPGGTAQNIGFRLGNDVLTATSRTLQAGKWYHVACVWDAATMRIYINGVLEDSGPVTGGGAPVNPDNLIFGRQAITATPVQYFGVIEEFRLWNTARTQSEIRDNMCRPLTLPDADLACYLQYNEDGGTVAVDASGNGNDGDTSQASQVCSEAPMGDDSVHDYYDEAGWYFLTMPAGGDTFTADDFSGTWTAANKSGIHMYRVNDAPEPSRGPMGSKQLTSRGYWGVFVTGLANDSTYSVTYTYDQAGIGDTGNLDLMFRHQGCAPWINLDATHNPGPPATLTQNGLSGTEFILGSLVDPRNAINFDGTSAYVDVPDNATLDLTTAGTLESWIYLPAAPTALKINAGIINKGNATNGYSLTTDAATGDQVVLTLYNGGGSDTVTSATILNRATWYHIVATWDSITTLSMNLYINGVLDAGSKASPQASGIPAGNLTIGSIGAGNYFQGWIDEVRVWKDVALPAATIDDWMCKKLIYNNPPTVTNGHPNWDAAVSNVLGGYWRFDEETASTNCPDYSSNSNNGAMTNFVAPIPDARICSSAPIGDWSAYNYGAGASTVTLNPTGDPFTVTANGGVWAAGSGIHVYRLDEAPVYGPDLWATVLYPYTSPNGLTPPVTAVPPPVNWSSMDYYLYFGVFVTDPASGVNQPVYDVVYNYNANPMTPLDDSILGLARRDGYCDRTWGDPGASVALNTVANTLTFTGDTQNGNPLPAKQNPEYILGGRAAPLAITLASFTATAGNGCVDVAWETATEINTGGFYVWRSDNPLTGFVRIDNSFVSSNAVVETMGAKYAFRDCGVDFSGRKPYYYMLEEIEIDAKDSGNMHGPIGPVSETISAAQPTGGADSKVCFIDTLM